MDRLDAKAIKTYKEIILILDQCIDDYLFVMDLDKDTYFISPHAMKRFNIPSYEFSDSLPAHKKFVYEDDLEMLLSDMNKLVSGKKNFHNLQYRWIGKDGIPIWINCRSKSIKDHDGNVKYIIGCINEIGKRQVADNDSGLLGEMSFKNFIYPIHEDITQGFILRIDIDDFKNINENFGVKYGDVILKQVGNCIKKLLTKNQQLYRIVADEFIVMDVVGSKEDARDLYNAIRRSITCYVESINYDIYLTISAGILDFHDYPNKSYNSIMQWTEFALNQSKTNGKNTYTIFKQEAYQEFLRKNKLTKELHKAVNQQFKGFEVYFQPIIDMKTEKIHSMEALLRFECDEFGKISPLEFIPLLEESDLIIPVGRWVLDQALKAVSMFSNIKVQINMSYVQVLKTPALNDILNIIKNYKIENNQLVIELTESGFIESNKNFIDFCNGLKKENILLALDDFGTGYSNFHYLYNLKPDYIKIDRTLMKNALSNEYENRLLKHMVDMAHSVGVKICIEGIEEKEELEHIMLLKPDYIQGFYYGRPASLSVFMESYEI
ncbi:EAL domain-containing protein [Coprobacillus sp. AF36-10BH]|nr:EAL domain-containing protein [Coprobacillus sp. AF36-10BH]